MSKPAHATPALEAPALATVEAASQTEPLGSPGRAERGAMRDAALLRRQAWLATAACGAAAVLVVEFWRADRATVAAGQQRAARAAAVAADAQAIARLQRLPVQATETGLPSSDLLQRVAQAMQAAGLPADALVSTLPQPPRRLPNSDHAEVVHRLLFEGVSMESLARFGHALTYQSALRLSALQLGAGRERERWDADVSVSYWVLAPAPSR